MGGFMKTKHTKGKWLSIRDKKGGWIFVDEIKASNRIACVEKNIEANARLIASAPELLEACKNVLAHMLKYDYHPDQENVVELKKAIKKAEGE